MNQILYENRCKCNEDFSIVKKRKGKPRSEGKPLQYPKANEITSKTFHMKYNKHLSLTAKFILNNFQNKYIYYKASANAELLRRSRCSRSLKIRPP